MKHQHRSLWIVLVVIAGLLGWSQPATAQDLSVVTDDIITELEAIIETEMAYFYIPGMAVAVIDGDQIIYTNGFGYRDLENGLPFTPETLFRIGSTTKSMTSLMIAQLVDEGALSWDTPVTDIFPDFQTVDPELTAQLTVRDLMGMGTGLESDALAVFYWQDWTTIDDLLAEIAAQSQVGVFHEHYAYNNEVYALAGYVATMADSDSVTLDAYRELLQTRVFDPIGMSTAILTDDMSELGDNYALPYTIPLSSQTLEPELTINPPISLVAPAGAVWSSAEEMARYLLTQMNGGVTPDGERIVSAESLMTTGEPGVAISDYASEEMVTDAHYGMGWVTMNVQGSPIRFHGGGWTGYSTQMVIIPEFNVGIIVFANSSLGGFATESVVNQFGELLYEREPQVAALYHGVFDEMVSQLEMFQSVVTEYTVDAETVAALVGDYEQGWQVTLRDDSTLWIEHGAWVFQIVPFTVGGENAYIVVNNTADGTVVMFEVNGDDVSLVVDAGTSTLLVHKLP